MTFDGDDVASSGTDENRLDFNGGDAFSVAGWFRRDTASGKSQKFLMSKMDPNETFPGWFLAWRDNNAHPSTTTNLLNFFMRDDSGGSGNGFLEVQSDPVTSSDFVHIAVTYDGSGNTDGVNFYLNGQTLNVKSSQAKSPFDDTTSTDNAAPFNLGGRDDVGSFIGAMDNVGVWERVLSESEIQTLAIPEPATVALVGLGGVMLLSRRRR